MKNLRSLLDIKLLTQPFDTAVKSELSLDNAILLARIYATMENCISVLSDMKTRKSYVYYGAIADELGLKKRETEINSIWEDDLFSLIHTDDLQKKYRLELKYFQYLTTINAEERSNYEVITKLKIQDKTGKYRVFKHRLIYISSLPDGSAWLALCLYSQIPDHPGFGIPDGVIINTRDGIVMMDDGEVTEDILSAREKQVLQLIKKGYKSKDIALLLALSTHTVNRHRQNIYEKLNAVNAIEACRAAEAMGLLK